MSTTAASHAQTFRAVRVNLDLEELERSVLVPLRDACEDVQAFALHFANLTGEFESPLWEARLDQPPTVTEIGSVFLLIEELRDHIKDLQRAARGIEKQLGRLDSMRLDEETRWGAGN